MKKFRIIVRGIMSAKKRKAERLKGFFTARSVEADNAIDAQMIALRLIGEDPRIPEQMSEWDSGPPDIYIEETIEIHQNEEYDPEPQGFIWFC